MTRFKIVILGHFLSLFGTKVVLYVLALIEFNKTQSALNFSIISISIILPSLILSPLIGGLIDRFFVKKIFIFAELLSSLTILTLFTLYKFSMLSFPIIVSINIVIGIFESTYYPGLSKISSLLNKKNDYKKASGILSSAVYISDIIPPLFAAFFLSLNDYSFVFILDFISYLLSVFCIIIALPKDSLTRSRTTLPNYFGGIKIIFRNSKLRSLQLMLFILNFISSSNIIIIPTFILLRTSNNVYFGIMQSIAAFSGFLGSLFVIVDRTNYSDSKKIYYSLFLTGIFGMLLFSLSNNLYLWILGVIFMYFFTPYINAITQSFWQINVNIEDQGIVFASKRLIARIASPLSMVITGYLIDKYFNDEILKSRFDELFIGNFIEYKNGFGSQLLLFILSIIFILVILFSKKRIKYIFSN